MEKVKSFDVLPCVSQIFCTLADCILKRLNDRSRMSREVHVRFWESLKGKFLWATHLGGAACEGRPYPDGLKKVVEKPIRRSRQSFHKKT